MNVGHDERMEHDWKRLGKALKAARRAPGVDLTQEEMAEELGLGRSVIQLIEGGNEYKKPTPSIRAYASRVGWAGGSVERVLAGGDPVMATKSAAAEAQPEPDPTADTGLPVRIVHELKGRGELLDTAVIPLGDGGSMVVVVKGKPGASPEEIQRNLEAWRAAHGHLLELDYRKASERDEQRDA